MESIISHHGSKNIIFSKSKVLVKDSWALGTSATPLEDKMTGEEANDQIPGLRERQAAKTRLCFQAGPFHRNSFQGWLTVLMQAGICRQHPQGKGTAIFGRTRVLFFSGGFLLLLPDSVPIKPLKANLRDIC